jgi:hypothetical protein
MRRELALVVSLTMAAGVAAFADDEPVATEEQDQEATAQDEARPDSLEPRRKIKVLEDPYQIASFYRSSQVPTRRAYFGGYPIDSPTAYPIAGFYRGMDDGRHPIAGFYRGTREGRYSRFWVGAGGSRVHRFGRAGFRHVGASDLCFAAPTVLLPFSPLVVELR